MKMFNKGLGTLVMGLGVVAGHCQAGMRDVKFYSANRFSDVAIGSLDNGLNELSGFLNCCKKASNPQGFDEAMELIDLGLRAARIARKGFDLGLVENVHKITGNLGVQPCIFDRQDEKAIYDYFGNDEKIIGYIKEIQKVFQKISKNKSTPNFRERNQSCKASIKTAHSCNVQALKTSYQSRNGEKLSQHIDEGTQTMSPVEEEKIRQDELWNDLGEQNVSALTALGDLSNERGIAPETFIQAFDNAEDIINLLLNDEKHKDLITSQKMISTLVSFYHPLLHRDLAKAYSSFDKHTEAVLKNFLELTCRTLEDLGENEVSDEVRECLCDKPLRGLDGCRSLFNWISRRAEKHLY